MTTLDAIVRQAYREDPRAAHELLADYAECPDETAALFHMKHAVRWSHFLARIRDLARATRSVANSVTEVVHIAAVTRRMNAALYAFCGTFLPDLACDIMAKAAILEIAKINRERREKDVEMLQCP